MAFSPLASIQAQERLVIILVFIAGYVDAYGYMTYATYLSFISGNTTQSGYSIGEGKFAEAMPHLIAILLFVIGIIVGTWIISSDQYQSRKKKLFGIIVFLLALTTIITQLGEVNRFVPIAVLSFAMGIMNTTINQIGAQLVNLTFVTGTLSRMAKHVALGIKRIPLQNPQGLWDTHWYRAAMLTRVWSMFLFGALLSGVATPHLAGWALLLPILILLILIIFTSHTGQSEERENMEQEEFFP
jgi:uncharacterized membrane protein YoaK (UPF0700 family)